MPGSRSGEPSFGCIAGMIVLRILLYQDLGSRRQDDFESG